MITWWVNAARVAVAAIKWLHAQSRTVRGVICIIVAPLILVTIIIVSVTCQTFQLTGLTRLCGTGWCLFFLIALYWGKNWWSTKTQVHEITLPIREQLQITENLIQEKEQELQGELANLRSVTSQRAKAVIAHDIEQIERAIDGLELQQAELTKRLNIQMPSDEQLQDIEVLAAELAADLDEIRQDFESRHRLIEMLNVQAILKVEDGQKVVYAECLLGSRSLLIACNFAYVDVN